MNDYIEQLGDAAAPEEAPLSAEKSFWYSIANLGYGMFFSFNNAVIALFLAHFTKDYRFIGWMSSSHSMEGIVIQPVIGAWSDRLRTKLGRRRPFMLAAIPLCSIFMILTPLAANLPGSVRLGAIIVLIFAFTVLFNVAFDPYQALMPDITPPVQRGRVMASWTLIGVVGQASILMIPMDLTVKFYVVALVMLVTTLLTCKFVREPVLPPHSDGKVHRSFKQEFAIANRGLRALEQARRGLMVYGLYGIGVGAIMPFLTLFVKHITKCTDGQAQQMFMILMISTAVAVLPFGWIADKIGSRRVLIIGIVLIATASILGIFVVTLSQIALVMALAGIGNAAQSAAAYPLMTQLIPRDEVGLYTGLQTVALSIAQPITVVVVGQMMNSGNFRSIFIVCAFSMFIGLAVLLSINMNVAAEEVKARQLELDGASA